MSDLAAEYRSLKPQLDAAVARVLASGRYVFGDELERFERAFARLCGTRYALGVGSGTAALELAVAACGLGPGDEVLTVANTDSPTASAITRAGASLGFVDTDPMTFCMDPAALEARITERTAAVVPVHLFGHPADMDPILRVARARGLLVIEDGALAVGARYRGRPVGGIGDVGCFSLAPSKVLGGYGDGGIIVTDDEAIAERVRILRNYGHDPRLTLDERDLRGFDAWHVLAEGGNERLDTLHAALLAEKLPTLDDRIEARRNAAALYDELLADVDVVLPYEAPGVRHVYFAYTVLVDDRERVRRGLAEQGVASRLYYNPPLHLQPAFARLGLGLGSFPVTERVAARMLALPVFPQIGAERVERVAAALARVVDGARA